jgi:hypothetical protein
MVFGDYELIHTTRVNKQRTGSDPYRNRQFQAQGGYVSLYLAFSLGLISAKLTDTSLCTLIPSQQTLSRAGFRQYLRVPGKYILLPAILGYVVGINVAGDPLEHSNLTLNAPIYQKEI